uniref:Uncharacterized protein n=1 Tax=Oncorhynchus tshawytscha TaxID=74940 RepID=A0AAZ3QP09_ONCTS
MSAALKVPKNTVASIILKWKRFGTIKTLPRTGHLDKLSNRGRRALVREATKNPMVTLVVLLEGSPISAALHQSGLLEHVQMFINYQNGQIIIITVVVEGAASQHLRSKCQLAFHSRSLRVSLPLLLSLES